MEVSPRRFVKPLAPPVVAQRDEMEALSQIKDFEVHTVVSVDESGEMGDIKKSRCHKHVVMNFERNANAVDGRVKMKGWDRERSYLSELIGYPFECYDFFYCVRCLSCLVPNNSRLYVTC